MFSIDLQEYIEDLSQQAIQTYQLQPNQVSVELNTESMIMTIDMAVPCGLVLNELFSNILKHAFPDGRPGRILVTSHTSDGREREIRIRDDGCGLPANFEQQTLPSLGLKLVHLITENQLKGQVEFHRKTPGTEVVIRFKEPQNDPRI